MLSEDKAVFKREGRPLYLIKGSIHPTDITIVNIYAFSIRAPKYMKQTPTELREEINSNTIIVGNFFFEFYLFFYTAGSYVICFIHISVYMSIPISQFIPPSPPHPLLSPLSVHTFVFYICVSISALQTGSSVPFF